MPFLQVLNGLWLFFQTVFWIVVLNSIAVVLLYTSLFLTVRGHSTFSTYIFSNLRWNAMMVFSACTAQKKWSFPLRISSVSVTRSAVSCRFSLHLLKKSLMQNFIFCAVLRRYYCPYFTVIQEEKFKIGSESCHFVSGVSFLLSKIACILFAAFIAITFLRFISSFVSSMQPRYLQFLHSWVALFIKYCLILSLLI